MLDLSPIFPVPAGACRFCAAGDATLPACLHSGIADVQATCSKLGFDRTAGEDCSLGGIDPMLSPETIAPAKAGANRIGSMAIFVFVPLWVALCSLKM